MSCKANIVKLAYKIGHVMQISAVAVAQQAIS